MSRCLELLRDLWEKLSGTERAMSTSEWVKRMRKLGLGIRKNKEENTVDKPV